MFDKPFYHLIICPTLKVIYSPVPKAACSSLKTYLRRELELPQLERPELLHSRRRNGFTYPHMVEREDLMRMLFAGPIGGGYFKFTVGRNPFSRLRSAYADLVRPSRATGAPRGTGTEDLRLTYCRAFDRRPSEVPFLNFGQFVRAIPLHDPAKLDRHWQVQSVLNCANLFRYDMVLQVEELGTRATALVRRAGLKSAFDLRINVTEAEIDELVFDEEMRDIVRRVYARDFVRFRYDPNVVPLR